jgi:hypothetical protein
MLPRSPELLFQSQFPKGLLKDFLEETTPIKFYGKVSSNETFLKIQN